MIAKTSLKKALQTTLITSACFTPPALSFGTDPVSSYLTQGQSVGDWHMSLGNGLNYYIPVRDQRASTMRGNLTVKPGKINKSGDALHLTWKCRVVKNEWGGNALYDSTFTIGRANVNIDSVKDVAALVLNIKVHRAPNELTKINLQCQNSNKCGAQFPINTTLRKLDKGVWINLPIPLMCFNPASEFDFSQLSGIAISTQGKLELEIANIGLAPLPEGATGC